MIAPSILAQFTALGEDVKESRKIRSGASSYRCDGRTIRSKN